MPAVARTVVDATGKPCTAPMKYRCRPFRFSSARGGTSSKRSPSPSSYGSPNVSWMARSQMLLRKSAQGQAAMVWERQLATAAGLSLGAARQRCGLGLFCEVNTRCLGRATIFMSPVKSRAMMQALVSTYLFFTFILRTQCPRKIRFTSMEARAAGSLRERDLSFPFITYCQTCA